MTDSVAAVSGSLEVAPAELAGEVAAGCAKERSLSMLLFVEQEGLPTSLSLNSSSLLSEALAQSAITSQAVAAVSCRKKARA